MTQRVTCTTTAKEGQPQQAPPTGSKKEALTRFEAQKGREEATCAASGNKIPKKLDLEVTDCATTVGLKRTARKAISGKNSPSDKSQEADQEGEAEFSEPSSQPNESQSEKRFACPHMGCPKFFSRKVRLTAHMHLHYGTQPHKCPFEGCTSAFSEKQNLKIHLRIHTDERPFSCSVGCGLTFRTKGNMLDH